MVFKVDDYSGQTGLEESVRLNPFIGSRLYDRLIAAVNQEMKSNMKAYKPCIRLW
jgi:hypothetical protein